MNMNNLYFEKVNCNLCGFNGLKKIYSMPDRLYHPDQWFTVVECQSCGLGFVNPRPTFLTMPYYYPSSFYEDFERNKKFHNKRYRKEYEVFKHYIDNNDYKGKFLLDIGCANGDFPRYMISLGWNVEGVEISKNSKPIYDFKVYNQEFTKIPVNYPFYDVITAWAVLEHTHDPMSYFIKAGNLIKKGGLFVFLVTNFKSVSSRYLFREDIPRHLYFFTEETIRKYTSSVGLELVKVDYSDSIYTMFPVNWLLYYFYRLRGKKLEYKNIPLSRGEYFLKYQLSKTIFSNFKYAAYLGKNPLNIVSMLFMPAFTKYQIWSKNYGIVTYIAKKI
ncbi:MAG: class I SAM-dependent methyltransferase [Desulfobacteraceae bacterium]|nr:MAG: class I SAM-dependent methyltransferase [Desulfobacteraceae bacterium]